jgi:hypothetical protein
MTPRFFAEAREELEELLIVAVMYVRHKPGYWKDRL